MYNIRAMGIGRLDTDTAVKKLPTVYSIRDRNDGSKVIPIPEYEKEGVKPQHMISIMDRNSPDGELSLIDAYRELAKASDVDEAMREIINECFSSDGVEESFRPMFKPDSTLTSATQKKIQEAFDYVYHTLLDFDKNGQSIFRQWYIDGKFMLHMAVDTTEKTIKSVTPIDPKQCRRYRQDFYNPETGLVDKSRTSYFFLYCPSTKANETNLRMLWKHDHRPETDVYVQFGDEAMAYADSGIVDQGQNIVLSHLYKAIIPFNNLKMMEEAMIIYRIVRAPERRAFFIDVGGMGNSKALQYINDIKNTFNNKTFFDSSTNSFINKKTVHSMVEDYYLPRRDGQKGTDIQNLGGAENLGVTKDIEYLRDKFYRSLNVPIGRLNAEMQNSMLLLGRVSEMQRDEYRFRRFIDTLRSSFMPLIEKLLMTELMLRGVIKSRLDWEDKITPELFWDYKEDNSFVEIKKQEKIRAKVELLDAIENHVGKYFSRDWVRKEVLGMTDAEIKDSKEEMDTEAEEEMEKQNRMNGGDSDNDENDDEDYGSGGGAGVNQGYGADTEPNRNVYPFNS